MTTRDIQDSRRRRREPRRRTLPLQVRLCSPSLPYMINCILRDRSKSGACIEFENEDQSRGVKAAHVLRYVWIHIPTEEIWQEAVVRWSSQRRLGISFVGKASRRPPDWMPVESRRGASTLA